MKHEDAISFDGGCMKPEELAGKCVVTKREDGIIFSVGRIERFVFDPYYRAHTFFGVMSTHNVTISDYPIYVWATYSKEELYDSKEELLKAFPDDPVVLRFLTEC